MAAKSCKNCLFWKIGKTFNDCDGICRRYPPILVVGDRENAFIAVYNYEWCGEWRPKTLVKKLRQPTQKA
jgi:hypothetical protein